jgi:predicted ATPase/DNA-binding SARP family transcriptional activator
MWPSGQEIRGPKGNLTIDRQKEAILLERTEAERSAEPLTIALLGPFEVRLDGQPLPHLRSRKEWWLLALLILRSPRPVERIWLAGMLWPESAESDAASNLRRSLYLLRRAFGNQAHRLHAPRNQTTVSLDLSGATVDVIAFDAAIAQGDASGLERAVTLYRGPLLEDCMEAWAYQERRPREQAFLMALEQLAALAMARNEPSAAVGLLRRAVSLDPMREKAQRALMQALATSGDYAGAILAYRELRRQLHEFNLDPDPETSALFQQIRADARCRAELPSPLSPPVVSSPPPRYIPQPVSSLVGREQEIQEITARLASARLVTLTGTGGVGKTRLAIQVAEETADDYTDGAWFVDLAALVDPALVSQAVASVLHVPDQVGRPLSETLLDYLRAKHLLLVLDSCEHLLEPCARLADKLLQGCPRLRLLATSRQSLGIAGESVWRVPSLDLPPAPTSEREDGTGSEEDRLARLQEYAAIRLFAERALQSYAGFRLTARNAPAVTRICRRLDGIPLAIELAAARMRALPPEQIASRLDNRFRLLTDGSRTAPPRQQTLLATLDWSYDLLSAQEQAMLCHLAVFAGGWTLDAAEAVCADFDDVLDLLSSLVDKSLVVFEVRGEAAGRYRLLETIRQYGQERLAEMEEGPAMRGRHRDYFLALAEAVEPLLSGPEQGMWLERLETEHVNLRAALDWCQAEEEGAEAGLRLAGALYFFWQVRGYLSAGRAYLGKALGRKGAARRTKVRAKASLGAGILATYHSDYGAAEALYEESLTISRELGDRRGIAAALYKLGSVAYYRGDYEAARVLCEESLSIFREIGDREGIVYSLHELGNVAGVQGDYGTARTLREESLAINREVGNRRGVASSVFYLGYLASLRGDYEAARVLYEESLAISRELGNKLGIVDSLEGFGNLASLRGDYEAARVLYEESLAICRELGGKHRIAYSLECFGNVACTHGDYGAARVLYEESLAISRELGDRFIAKSLAVFANLAATQNQPERAVRLWGAEEALRQTLGFPLSANRQKAYDRNLTAAREALGEETYAAAWEQGRAMTLEHAIEEALQT